MSSSEDENDQLANLEDIRDEIMSQPRAARMQVSAWDDDDNGVDSERSSEVPDERAFLTAAENGNIEEVKRLYMKNPHVLECADKDGYTPLHRACYGNHIQVVEFLLKAGADIDATTQDGWMPLHSACCWNNVECAAALISHGADINCKTKGGQTALHLASASSHNSPTLQLLLLHPDTDPTVVNCSGDTAYDIAKRSGKYYPIFEIAEPCLNEI